jgi:lysozyme
MLINNAGIDLIKKWEGFSQVPYLCSAGVPTIGIGTTRYPDGSKVRLKDKAITIDEAEDLLQQDLAVRSKELMKILPKTLNDNQFNALLSFVYNLSVGDLAKSTLLKLILKNPNQKVAIKKQFLRWVNAGGKKCQGLVNRRNDEIKLYFTGI